MGDIIRQFELTNSGSTYFKRLEGYILICFDSRQYSDANINSCPEAKFQTQFVKFIIEPICTIIGMLKNIKLNVEIQNPIHFETMISENMEQFHLIPDIGVYLNDKLIMPIEIKKFIRELTDDFFGHGKLENHDKCLRFFKQIMMYMIAAKSDKGIVTDFFTTV